jgi:rare lipoprotein A
MIKVIISSIALSLLICSYEVMDIQTGKASFYNDTFHGCKTASGDLYNTKEYTAAHREYPFGSMVRVTNLKNKKTVIVEINDRGPHSRGRIIDLSKAAALELDMVDDGIVKTKIELLGEISRCRD